jgi:hypothetical protein
VLQAQPLSLTPADVQSFSSLSEAQLAALLGELDATPTLTMDALPYNGMAGTFWSLQKPDSAPFPYDVSGAPVWPMSNGSFLLNDLNYSYPAASINKTSKTVTMLTDIPSPGDGGDTNSYTNFTSNYTSPDFGTNLWLEITSVDSTNKLANVLAHNTSDATFYQFLSKTNLLQPTWTLGDIMYGTAGTNATMFSPFYFGDSPMTFFYAHQADAYVTIDTDGAAAVEPLGTDPGRAGVFYVNVFNATNDLTIPYTISGTAINGVDYTNLSGVLTVPAYAGSAQIYVQPLADNLVEGAETVTLTLEQTNTFLISESNYSATNQIFDSSTEVSVFWGANAKETDSINNTSGQAGYFQVYRNDFRNNYPALTVYFQTGGSAANGVDYINIASSVTFAAGANSTNIYIQPIYDNQFDDDETGLASIWWTSVG